MERAICQLGSVIMSPVYMIGYSCTRRRILNPGSWQDLDVQRLTVSVKYA